MSDQESDTKVKFKSLKEKVSASTLKAVKTLGFKYMTDIQAAVLPRALDGDDIVATAKTGSGKTLAFLLPAVETVVKCEAKETSGKHPYRKKSKLSILFCLTNPINLIHIFRYFMYYHFANQRISHTDIHSTARYYCLPWIHNINFSNWWRK